jgi:hypothetical protein
MAAPFCVLVIGWAQPAAVKATAMKMARVRFMIFSFVYSLS